MSTPYQRDYDPPFPQLFVILRTADERRGPLAALIDSGADATLAPTVLLHDLGVLGGQPATIRSHFGEPLPVKLFVVDIWVENAGLPGVYVVGDDVGDEIILGRDVLNKLPLFLDGPTEQTEVLDDATAKQLRARRK